MSNDDDDDTAPGDDGRPLGAVTAAVLARARQLARARGLGPAAVLRVVDDLTAEATVDLLAGGEPALTGRSANDVSRAAAQASSLLRQIASEDVFEAGLRQLKEGGRTWRRRHTC